MKNLFHSGLAVAYFTALIGFLIGCISVFTLKRKSERFQGIFMGFSGGTLLAFVCFELLPEAFEGNGFYYAIIGMIFGVFVTIFLEEKLIRWENKIKTKDGIFHTALLIALSVGIHTIPEGMSIGSMVAVDFLEALKMCFVIILHCIPEAMALTFALKCSGYSFSKSFFCFLILSIPMGFGGWIGYALIGLLQETFASLCFSFAGGVMLYVTCGEIIPQSKQTWNGRMTTIGALGGFLVGVVLIAGIHFN